MDPRVKRTRARFRQAMRELLIEQEYESITVSALAERAGSARITFYRHYDDREHLLMDCLDEIEAELLDRVEPPDLKMMTVPFENPPIQELYRYIAANRDLFIAMIESRVASLVLRSIRTRIATNVAMHLDPETLALPVDIVTQYMATSAIGMITWWLEEEEPYPVDYLAQAVHRLMLAAAGYHPPYDNTHG